MKHLLAAVLAVVVTAVIAPAALADAPNPLSLTGSSVTNSDGSRTLTVTGTFGWEKGACDKASGYAIAWNDSTAPGNLVANGVAVGTPTDNAIHVATCGATTGTFGPLSHTYPASVNNALQVCVVTYHNKDLRKTAGGSTRQTDNSIEENKDNSPMVCYAFNPPPPPPTDVCPNIEGVQTSVPAGMTKDGAGNCVTPPVVPGPPTTTTVTIEKVVVVKQVITKKVKAPAKKAKKAAKKAKIKVKAAHKVLKPSVLPHTR